MQTGVVGEQSVVTQRHVLLLPLLIEGFSTPLQQHALQRGNILLDNIHKHCNRPVTLLIL